MFGGTTYLPEGYLDPQIKILAHNLLFVWGSVILIANKIWAQGHCKAQQGSWTLPPAQLESAGFKIYL